MGFLTPEPVQRPHYCDLPPNPKVYGEGTRWECDECQKIYRVELVFDRNISALEWVDQARRT